VLKSSNFEGTLQGFKPLQGYAMLIVRNLTVKFRKGNSLLTAVDSVSFDIHQGQSLGIIGESGSGKSVTALTLMKLLPSPPAIITADRLSFSDNHSDTDLLAAGNREIRRIRGNRISMIFQEPMSSLNPVMQCGMQVIEAIRAHQAVSREEARKKALDLFNAVRLPRPAEMLRNYPHELSGGQKQRVMIAMAIASGPDLLIADEPTTSLDAGVQLSIIKLLKDLRQELGMAILFITHDLGLAKEIADDILVMRQGKIVESGPAAKVFSQPEHPYTKGLLACRPSESLRLRRLPTVDDFLEHGNGVSSKDLFRELARNEIEELNRKAQIYSSEPIVKARNLKTWFRSRKRQGGKAIFIKAVDDVSLDVWPGEVLGLVGESGCGKTTLGRTLLRLVEPSGGQIFYKNREITTLKGRLLRKARKDIQIIFQDPYTSLNPRMTAGAAIMEPMVVHGIATDRNERKELAMQLLEKAGLEREHFYRYPHEFSGGQRQRVGIARALAAKPEFIVCDESVSALDVSVQAQVLNLLADLKDEFGLTFIFISHDMSVVKFISDRILEMKDGRIMNEPQAASYKL
jgi:peptide/nickel transport system ATP-binding protein